MAKLKLFLVLLVLATMSACAAKTSTFDYSQAAAEVAFLELPVTLTALTVDGTKVDLPLLHSDPYRVKVPAGERNFTFVYEGEWGNAQRTEYHKSKVMQSSFNAQAGMVYKFDHTKQESSELATIKPFFDGFSAWMVMPGGQQVAATAIGKYEDGLARLLKGIFTPSAQAGAATVAAAPAAAVKAAPVAAIAADSTNTVESMKNLWGSATEAERKAFMNWVISPR